MTEALEIRILDLVAELLADTFVVVGTLQTAGTVTAGTLQAFPDGLYHLFIIIQPNSHGITTFLLLIIHWIPLLSRKGKQLCQPGDECLVRWAGDLS